MSKKSDGQVQGIYPGIQTEGGAPCQRWVCSFSDSQCVGGYQVKRTLRFYCLILVIHEYPC